MFIVGLVVLLFHGLLRSHGTFYFTYELLEGGIGICDNPSSRLISCPDPGTPFEAINERFRMKYGYCKYLTSSFDADQLNQCLGSWLIPDGNIITAVANERVGSERWYYKFHCMFTRQDQPQWFATSLFAECSSLSSPTDGPEKVINTSVIPEEVSLTFLLFYTTNSFHQSLIHIISFRIVECHLMNN